MGADIIETDIEISADGKLFILHPGMEKVHLRMQDSIKTLPGEVVENFRLSNCDLTPTEWHIPRLEEAFQLLKGKCLINIDKIWNNPNEQNRLLKLRFSQNDHAKVMQNGVQHSVTETKTK